MGYHVYGLRQFRLCVNFCTFVTFITPNQVTLDAYGFPTLTYLEYINTPQHILETFYCGGNNPLPVGLVVFGQSK